MGPIRFYSAILSRTYHSNFSCSVENGSTRCCTSILFSSHLYLAFHKPSTILGVANLLCILTRDISYCHCWWAEWRETVEKHNESYGFPRGPNKCSGHAGMSISSHGWRVGNDDCSTLEESQHQPFVPFEEIHCPAHLVFDVQSPLQMRGRCLFGF